MSIDAIFQGSLFTSDFLTQSITSIADWKLLTDDDIDQLQSDLAAIFLRFPINQTPNEARTEDDLIWPILARIGWDQYMRQQNLTFKGREDVPDGLLFASADAKRQADTFTEEWRRYDCGVAIVESKRWKRPIDRRSSRRGEELAPSTQMLRYLRRVDDITTGKLRWGILTNGSRWRLYYAGARSISEQFFEIDLAALFEIDAQSDLLAPHSQADKRIALRLFALIFRRESFIPSATEQRTFHQRAMDEGKFYEERVASDLSALVFTKVYPLLARSIAGAAPQASLEEVRQAALILLYRLLFILYAEDRDLLPTNDPRYDDYGLRNNVRLAIGARKDKNDTFSATAARYWSTLEDLCRSIDNGDTSIGLPPYNGGLFDPDRTPLLTRIRLPDSVMADIIDELSFERKDGTRKYINYRDLSVQQLGSIYERLLEYEVVRRGGVVDILPNTFARKGSGSYYTPEDLVSLIIHETLEPLVESRIRSFRDRAVELGAGKQETGLKLTILKRLDPADRLLDLRICDPAMGSGHFLVSLVDYLTDQVIAAMAETETLVEWASEEQPYISPLADRIESIRNTILGNAEARNWTVDAEQLDDRHIIRRMVLKRCVYGVDKNLMAVELAKVALWLHSFTVGAPLSFLDHHLRCGDSLFGSWVKTGINKATTFGSPLLLHQPMKEAYASAASMQLIEGLPDAEIAEAHRSQDIFDGVQSMTAPLNAFLSLLHAVEWLELKGKDNIKAVQGFFDGSFGDPFDIALGKAEPVVKEENGQRFASILVEARKLVREERFFHWQVSFPGVWSDWDKDELQGGFDAVIGNPPWDKMRFEEIPWFEQRVPEISRLGSGDERKRAIEALRQTDPELFSQFELARARSNAATNIARTSGLYPLLSGGDTNIYSLFVEQSRRLLRPGGFLGLLVPSGIASDETSSSFFEEVSTGGQLRALIDFENRRTRYALRPFFEDIDSRFKFCVFVLSRDRHNSPARCAFFLQATNELAQNDVLFEYSASDFARVNPNTKTAPIFRSKRQAEICAAIYAAAPVYNHHAAEIQQYPIRLGVPMHITHDSKYFKKRQELEEDGFYHIGNHILENGTIKARPLYEGKMMMDYDHRSSDVAVNLKNVKRPAQPKEISNDEKIDPSRLSIPRFWVRDDAPKALPDLAWLLVYKNVCSPTNRRGMIGCVVPTSRCGHSLQILVPEERNGGLDAYKNLAPLLLANISAISFDFVARSKIQGQNLSWYIFEQLPVIPPARFATVSFGAKTAGEIVRQSVLELTYTANDMATFARDMQFVDNAGQVKQPFIWDEERRLHLRAKLDAVFFHLYGITDRDDVRYIYSTFPIIENQEAKAYGGRYRSRDLCLAYINALGSGQPDANVQL